MCYSGKLHICGNAHAVGAHWIFCRLSLTSSVWEGGLLCPKGLDLRDLAVPCTVGVPCVLYLCKTLGYRTGLLGISEKWPSTSKCA